MDEDERTATLTIACSDADPDELEALTGRLRAELLDLGVTAVEPRRSDDVPAGAKPADAITIGELVVALTPPVLSSVVRLIELWVNRQRGTTVKLTIGGDSLEVGNASEAAQHKLVEHFLDRHAG